MSPVDRTDSSAAWIRCAASRSRVRSTPQRTTRHPATAKFIATKLARRFVADEPPKSLVDRVAQTYTRTGGDIREMLRTIFFSPEFNSAEAYRAKIKVSFKYESGG